MFRKAGQKINALAKYDETTTKVLEIIICLIFETPNRSTQNQMLKIEALGTLIFDGRLADSDSKDLFGTVANIISIDFSAEINQKKVALL